MGKKKRRKGAGRKVDDKRRIIANSSYLVLASTIIWLYAEHGYRQKRIDRILNGYVGKMNYIHEKDLTPDGAILEAQKHTGRRLTGLFLGNDYKAAADKLTLACMTMAIREETGWGKQKMDLFVESHMALVYEIWRRVSTYSDIINWCAEMTGFDMRKECGW